MSIQPWDRASGMLVPVGTWNTLKLCGTVGPSGTWQLFLNGTSILGPWAQNNGTAPIQRVEIGSASAGTFTFNVDDVVVATQ